MPKTIEVTSADRAEIDRLHVRLVTEKQMNPADAEKLAFELWWHIKREYEIEPKEGLNEPGYISTN